MTQVSVICQFLHSHPAQTLEEVAAACGISGKELETLLYSGKLGTAAHKIICHCQACHKGISATGSKGRFCMDCAQKLENKAAPVATPATNTVKTPIKRHHSVEEEPLSATCEVEHSLENEPATAPVTGVASKNEESASPFRDSYGFTRFSEK